MARTALAAVVTPESVAEHLHKLIQGQEDAKKSPEEKYKELTNLWTSVISSDEHYPECQQPMHKKLWPHVREIAKAVLNGDQMGFDPVLERVILNVLANEVIDSENATEGMKWLNPEHLSAIVTAAGCSFLAGMRYAQMKQEPRIKTGGAYL